MTKITRPGTMLRLGLLVASSFTTYTMVLTLVPLYSLRLGASVALVGLLTASISFFLLLLAVRTGTLVDRYGPRRLLILGSGVLTVTPLFAVAAPNLIALFAV